VDLFIIRFLRTDRYYDNVVRRVDWMHLEPGGNSGRASGHGEWNTYTAVAIDGVIKLERGAGSGSDLPEQRAPDLP
jgi:hypothetical protein